MKMPAILLFISMFCTAAFAQKPVTTGPVLIVLGNVQDGGSPHIGCTKDCCRELFLHPDPHRMVSCLAVLDPENKMNWLFDATPNLPFQMKALKALSPFSSKQTPDGIFLTHAHIGHYTGLMYLGREAMGSRNAAVYAMPKMKDFLAHNGPWSQLLTLNNIRIKDLKNEETQVLSSNIKVRPFTVPHRDEFSETVGFIIEGPRKKALFIPDIDKWSKWDKSIIEEIKKVDYAFIDATFYDAAELSGRLVSEVPHPFVSESMELFQSLPKSEKDKIWFIHLNHTNPLLRSDSEQTKAVLNKGFHIARYQQQLEL